MNQELTSIEIELPDSAFRLFIAILQRGFYLKTRLIGNNLYLYSFLIHELGVNDEYIKNRIKIVFLDGKPVDDLHSCIIKEHSKIALSSAMPGLAGTILRQQSPLTSMREGITYKGYFPSTTEEGLILLKLFNLIIYDIGKGILKKGIVLNKAEVIELLQDKNIFEASPNILIDGQKNSPEELLQELDGFPTNAYISLSVSFL